MLGRLHLSARSLILSRVLSEERTLGLIGRIYDSAGDERLWPAFLEDLASAIDGTAPCLIYQDIVARRAGFAIFARGDPELERRYVESYSALDEFRNAWLSRFDCVGPEAIYAGEQLIEPAELRKTEYFNDFLSVHNIVYHLCAPLALHSRWACTLSCHRPANKEPFGCDELGLLRLLFPHLQRAIQLHRKFAELEGHHGASLDALDRLPTGVMLMGDRGQILEANCAAKLILNQNDGLRTDKEGLATSTPSQTRELRSRIAAAALTAQGRGVSAGGSLAIARPSGKRPLAVVIMPASLRAFPSGTGEPAVIVLVSDPESKVRIAPEIVAQVYGLTAAESRLAEQLMQGESLVHAAERLGVSHNTARTHLQRIYQKTGTTHQGDLVRLLLAGPASLSLRETP
jgi:DNA-binding CsgD family transcriptional regulator